MTQPLPDVVARFQEMWANCYPCRQGQKHPWHDNGTINCTDLLEWVETNGGPTIEGDGYEAEVARQEDIAWGIQLLEKELAEVEDPDMLWHVPAGILGAAQYALQLLKASR